MDARKADMLGYIRRKYNVPDHRKIVIKQGYITNDILSLTQSWYDSYDDPIIRKRKRTGAAASVVEGMHKLIDSTNEEIRALLEAREADEEMQALGNDWLREQIIKITDVMFAKLSDSIKALAQEAYNTTYAQSNTELGGISESAPPSLVIFKKEQFRLIFSALEKAKARMTARIEEAFDTPVEPEEVQKIGPGTLILGALALLLLAAILTGCEDTKKKAEQLAGDAEHLAKIEAEIAAFIANGVEKHEIVTEPGCCDDCADKEADGPFDMADYSLGENAPPFHPNCRCGVRVYAAELPEEPEFITVNDWLDMYTTPTVSGVGRRVELPDPNPRSWVAFEGLSSINRYVRDELVNSGNTPVVNIDENGIMTDAEGRYWIAVGPNVLDPDFLPDDKPTWANNFNWNVKIDAVVVDSAGNEYYIPCVPCDIKNHTYPNGIQQIGYAFPDGRDPHPSSGDGNAIEFMGAWIRDHGLGAYTLVGIIVYDA